MASKRRQQATSTTAAFAKWLEQAAAAERMVVGALLLESDAVCRVADILQPRHFYNQALGSIYRAIYTLWMDGERPDMLKVCEALLKSGELDKAGGAGGGRLSLRRQSGGGLQGQDRPDQDRGKQAFQIRSSFRSSGFDPSMPSAPVFFPGNILLARQAPVTRRSRSPGPPFSPVAFQ